ncbi:hypothetical protein [Silvanigrella aquatica]|uniref:Uncharacterized protein n=1 Tax=Silvanigrella aquatica TaxID=1915309 RepID=A0A1L4D046_9BACT|nr:hypothetical protein [Silvanigrella aquatica]APJ03568.1 hypothetical protein AXG55_06460 [Silvanigrella aquatica]
MGNIINISFLIAIIFFTKNLYAGSYLFCANSKGESHWAQPNLNHNLSWAPLDSRGFWLKGSLYIVDSSKSLHSGLKIDFSQNLNNRNKRANIYEQEKQEKNMLYYNNSNAMKVCQYLISNCQNSFGKDYQYIGAASYDLAVTDWGYIISENIVCPNWDFHQGLNIKIGYSAGEMVFENVFGILASGPLPEKGLNIAKLKTQKLNLKIVNPVQLNKKIFLTKKNRRIDLSNLNIAEANNIAIESIGSTKLRKSCVKWTKEGFIYQGFTFRGDQRPPEIIFKEGFQLRTKIHHLYEVNGFTRGAAYGGGITSLDSGAAGISTSPYYSDRGVGAYYYAKKYNGYTYFIDARKLKGYDLYSNSYAYEYGDKMPHFRRDPFHKPYEINYGTDISYNKIVGAFDLNGTFIPNPNYTTR